MFCPRWMPYSLRRGLFWESWSTASRKENTLILFQNWKLSLLLMTIGKSPSSPALEWQPFFWESFLLNNFSMNRGCSCSIFSKSKSKLFLSQITKTDHFRLWLSHLLCPPQQTRWFGKSFPLKRRCSIFGIMSNQKRKRHTVNLLFSAQHLDAFLCGRGHLKVHFSSEDGSSERRVLNFAKGVEGEDNESGFYDFQEYREGT